MSKARRVAGEVLSQLLSVPVLSGVLVTFIFFKLPANIPDRLGGFGWTLLFLSLIPLCSLLFYIPGKIREKARIIKRQRIASRLLALIRLQSGRRGSAKGPSVGRTVAGALLALTIAALVLWAYGVLPMHGLMR